MYWKDVLAKQILSSKQLTYEELTSLQREHPQLRVKTLDAAGKIPAIQLQGKKEWLKPREWANDHLRSLRAELSDVQARVMTICEDLKCDVSDTCPLVNQLKEQSSKDLAELNRLQGECDKLAEDLAHCKQYAYAYKTAYFDAAKVANMVYDESGAWMESLMKLNKAIEDHKIFKLQ